MSQLTIAAEKRSDLGKSAARRLRREGKVPAVVYGTKLPETLLIQVEAGPFQKILQSQAAGGLVEIRVNGARHTVLIKETVRDPVQGHLLHVDFHAVALDEEVQVPVPIQLVGEENRENDGGIVTLLLREIDVVCLPGAIPESLPLDVSTLAVGGTLTVKDVAFPEGVRPATGEDEAVVTVLAPAKGPAPAESEAEEAPAEGEAAGGEEEAGEGEEA